MPTYTPNYNIPKPLVNDPQDEDLWGDYLNDGLDVIDTALADIAGSIGSGVPSGLFSDFAGSTAPSGWLLCFGQAVSRTTYAPLFTAIGIVYGAGDGSTTFNLPDCRGRATAGKDDMGGTSANRLTNQSGGVNGDVLGAVGGAETHTLTIPQIPPHAHGIDLFQNLSGVDNGNQPRPANSTSVTLNTRETGGGNAHNNVQPTIIFNKIIKE